MEDIVALVNSHLHVDHIGANSVLARVPTYVQGAELAMLDQPEYTMTAPIPELVEWVALDGPTELLPGVTAVPAPGHTPGHQALVVETRLGRLAFLGDADSVAVDLHKWMNTPYDAAAVFTQHRDLQTEVFHNAASCLHAPGTDPEFLHVVPENSRRFRAVPVWLSLVAYGRGGHAEVVRRCNDHADRLAGRLAAIPGVSVLAPTRLNIVCFQSPLDPDVLVNAIARSGEAFLTTTVYRGTPAVRAAFSNWRTTDRDVDRLAEVIATVVVSDSP